MKRKIYTLFSLVLSILLCFQMPVFANDQDPEVNTSKINPLILPSYIEGTTLNDAGYSRRLLEYDSAANLNVIGFKTLDNSNVVKLFPYDVKYIDNNFIIDKNPNLTEKQNSLLTNEIYSYKNTANDFDLFVPQKINEVPIKLKKRNNSLRISPITLTATSSDALLENKRTVSYSSVFTSNDILSIKSDYSGIKISSDCCLQQTHNYYVDLEGLDATIADDGTIILASENGDKYSIVVYPNDAKFSKPSVLFSSNNNGRNILSVNATRAYTISITEISQSIISDSPVYSHYSQNNFGAFGSATIGTKTPYEVGRMYVKFDISSLSNIS